MNSHRECCHFGQFFITDFHFQKEFIIENFETRADFDFKKWMGVISCSEIGNFSRWDPLKINWHSYFMRSRFFIMDYYFEYYFCSISSVKLYFQSEIKKFLNFSGFEISDFVFMVENGLKIGPGRCQNLTLEFLDIKDLCAGFLAGISNICFGCPDFRDINYFTSLQFQKLEFMILCLKILIFISFVNVSKIGQFWEHFGSACFGFGYFVGGVKFPNVDFGSSEKYDLADSGPRPSKSSFRFAVKSHHPFAILQDFSLTKSHIVGILVPVIGFIAILVISKVDFLKSLKMKILGRKIYLIFRQIVSFFGMEEHQFWLRLRLRWADFCIGDFDFEIF